MLVDKSLSKRGKRLWNLPQYELVPILESNIDEVVNSNITMFLGSSRQQEHLKSQITDLVIELQAGIYCRSSALLNPLVKLSMIKKLQAASSNK